MRDAHIIESPNMINDISNLYVFNLRQSTSIMRHVCNSHLIFGVAPDGEPNFYLLININENAY